MADFDTLGFLAQEFAAAFRPLRNTIQTQGAFRDRLQELGWNFATLPPELDALRTVVADAASVADGGDIDSSQVPALVAKLLLAFKAIADLGSATGLDANFRNEFPRQLLDYLIVQYLFTHHPRWGHLLQAVGIVRFEDVPASGARLAFQRRVFAVEDFGTLFSDPLTYLKNSYHWGQSDFDGNRLILSLEGLLDAWNVDVREESLDAATLAQLKAGALSPSDVFDSALLYTFLESTLHPSQLSAGAWMFILPETATEKPGFAVLPFTTSGLEASIPISDNLTLVFKGGIDLSGGVGLLVRPNEDIKFLTGLASGTPSAVSGTLTISLRLGQPSSPILTVGTPNASRLEFGGVSTTAGTRADSSGKIDVFTEFALEAGKIAIQPASGEADGFLASVLPSKGFEVDFDLTVGFSTARGLYIGASGGFELTLPVHLDVGPISILSVMIAVRFRDGGIPIDLAASVKASLGGVVVTTAENLGVTANFTFPPDRKGNLGVANLALGFKHPTGLGVDINAGPVSGGGFLSFDDTIGRHSGAIELSVYGIAVKAFGLVDTVLPDGSKGYSFVVVISAEFTPIQLGFGFTLVGVGGLVGINRSMDEKALESGIQAGSIANVLFPRNVVQDAPTIIHDLARFFPAASGHYLFGPMAKLGWGTPTLITGTLGIILELPGPRLAILGVVRCALPTSSAALISLNLAIGGLLDFPGKLFWLEASLYDSHVVGFRISGGMAFRITWGDRPNFALAVGGFNPAYEPPVGFPSVKRCAVDFGINGNPSLTCQNYFAVTSNTAQAGASIDLRASGFGIDLSGHLGFDALFVFSPFSFQVDFNASVHVSFVGIGFGLGMHGTISGPTPWRIQARVCVSVWFADACLPVDISFGTNKRVNLPQLDPWIGQDDKKDPSNNVIGLQTAIADTNNWSGGFPTGAHPVVTLTQSAAATSQPIDPVGEATLHQKVLPLNYKLSKFGIYKPINHTSFSSPSVTIGSTTGSPPQLKIVQDFFAPALFKDMKGDDKLSSPSYERHDSGFTVDADRVIAGDVNAGKITYETHVIDPQSNETQQVPNFDLPLRHLQGMFASGASGRGGIRRSGVLRYVDVTAPIKVQLSEEGFVVADACSLVQNTTIVPSAIARTSAQNALEAHLVDQPSDSGQLRIIPSYLVRTAA